MNCKHLLFGYWNDSVTTCSTGSVAGSHNRIGESKVEDVHVEDVPVYKINDDEETTLFVSRKAP